jgi:signal transduction histidine kinase
VNRYLVQNEANGKNGGDGDRARLERELLEMVDAERGWIARTFHGGVCQSLHGMGFLCRVLEAKLKENGVAGLPEIAELQGAIRRAGREMREVLLWSRDGAGGEPGLVGALAGLAEGVSASVPCDFQCETGIEIEDGYQREQLIHIAHEGARVALCCGGITRMTIALSREGGEVAMTVRHDGDASAPGNSPAPATAWELLQMRARAIGARVATSTNPGEETKITCTLPIQS